MVKELLHGGLLLLCLEIFNRRDLWCVFLEEMGLVN